MKKLTNQSAFALVVTLILMAMIALIVVGYLGITRSDRATTSIFANRLRAKMMANSGLDAATNLLKENTRYGNYITAMPAPAVPALHYTEVYRPTDSAISSHPAKPDEYLQLSNAGGDILISRADPSANQTLAVEPRPPAETIPAAGPFTLTNPALSSANSYNFNQIVRLGSNSDGRLLNPDNQPAFGQWVRVRDSTGALIGRYAFFIEDESMKVNVNVAGNNVGGSNLRINDLALPAIAPAPSTQIEETDPAATLPTTVNRVSADTTLTNLGNSGSRLPSASTVALLNEWNTNFSDYAHLVTVLSKDDNTTAKGWQRLDLNALVASAADNPAKVAIATRIANWMRDAWTGSTPLASLTQEYQIFGNQRLRLQLAANIVDYIDSDSVPTDIGDVLPDGYTDPAYAIPVIGIEKIPYIGAIFIIYEASGRVGNTTTIKMKIRFNFVNLYESPLDLQQFISSIEVTGIPTVNKSGSTVFDVSTQTFPITASSLVPVTGAGYIIPAGVDGPGGADSGVRSFETPWLVPGTAVTFSLTGSRPNFGTEQVDIKVLGAGGARLDVTAAASTDTPTTNYTRTQAGSPTGDFLVDSDTQARTVAAIFLLERVIPTTSVTQNFGDPRYRNTLLNDRWRRLGQTDQKAIDDRLDIVDANPRVYAVDWFDDTDDRPLAFLRDGPMLNIGEIGNVSFAEYPWRTGYLQYPERASNAGNTIAAGEITTRRANAVDYVLTDLFCTNSVSTRSGTININTQQRLGTTQQHSLAPLFLGERIGTQPSLTQTMIDRLCINTGTPTSYSAIFDRRNAVGLPQDNTPLRPFFQIGELASVISRLVNSSMRVAGESRSTVTYSLLRNNATSTSETNVNFQRDMLVEQEFREVSNSITTRGNVFRVLYVGQAVKDINKNGIVDSAQEIQAEYLGESFVDRQASFTPEGTNPDAKKTSDSIYRILTNRPISE